MSDKLEKLGNSLVQHGPHSDRIYLMKLDPADMPALTEQLKELADRHDYGKIFAKVTGAQAPAFLNADYVEEARIPDYFNDKSDCVFLSRFRKPERKNPDDPELIRDVIAKAQAAEVTAPDTVAMAQQFHMRVMAPEDTPEMAEVYKVVFDSYPFPIHEPEYLAETMATHIRYFGIFEGNKLVALASCEMDKDAGAVEMTDFATLPDYRGNSFARVLLAEMERDMRRTGITTAYTIARAVSYGMNITFGRMGYAFTGTLVNNTQISGNLESMNIWYKPLLAEEA